MSVLSGLDEVTEVLPGRRSELDLRALRVLRVSDGSGAVGHLDLDAGGLVGLVCVHVVPSSLRSPPRTPASIEGDVVPVVERDVATVIEGGAHQSHATRPCMKSLEAVGLSARSVLRRVKARRKDSVSSGSSKYWSEPNSTNET